MCGRWNEAAPCDRRHLNESQRAMVAAKLATMPAHRPDKSANLPTYVSQPDAARLLNVSDRSLRTAASVQRHAIPELQRGAARTLNSAPCLPIRG